VLCLFDCCSQEEINNEIGDKCKITRDDISKGDEKLAARVMKGESTEMKNESTEMNGSSHASSFRTISKAVTVLEGWALESTEKAQNPEIELRRGFGLSEINDKKQYPNNTAFGKLNQPFTRKSGSNSREAALSGLLKVRERTSDWGSAYEDTLFRSTQFSLLASTFTDTAFSDTPCTDDNSFASNYHKITVPHGKVLALCLTKYEQRFRLLTLKTSLEEVVETFLSPDGGKKLPISFNSQKYRPRVMSPHQMAMTIEESLGKHFDTETQGLTFSVGPLNSKLCYKMSVCDLAQLQKILSLTNSSKCLEEALGSPLRSSRLKVHDAVNA